MKRGEKFEWENGGGGATVNVLPLSDSLIQSGVVHADSSAPRHMKNRPRRRRSFLEFENEDEDEDDDDFKGGRKMALKIWKIALLVEDVKEAEKLYVETLGLPVIERLSLAAMGVDGEAVFLDAGNVQLELIPKAAFNGAPERLATCGVHHLSFAVDDVPAMQEELKAKGAHFVLEAFSPVAGMTLAFFDGTNGVNLQLFNWRR